MKRTNRCINCQKEIEEHDLFKVEFSEHGIKIVSHWNCENPTWSPIKEDLSSLRSEE